MENQHMLSQTKKKKLGGSLEQKKGELRSNQGKGSRTEGPGKDETDKK